ncbi:hypothetical protein ES708_31466 [subsurface metagenome]
MERYLDRQEKYDQFCLEYKKLTGTDWKDHRIDYQFNQDEIIDTLSGVLEQSKDACYKLIDHIETDFSLTVEIPFHVSDMRMIRTISFQFVKDI